MHVRILLITIRSHEPVRALTLDAQAETAAGAGTLFHHRQVHKFASLDETPDGHILEQGESYLITVVRLALPFIPEPSGSFLEFLSLFPRDAKALPRDTGLRLQACAADIRSQRVHGRLGRTVVGIQVFDTTVECPAFCCAFAADKRSAGTPIKKRPTERPGIPRGRRYLMRLFDRGRTGFWTEQAEELHLRHPRGKRHCTRTGPCPPRSSASSSPV